ncbi:putative membrane protein [Burkholderia phage Maja]|uniref:Putative membrane protein n=1 Tax=Burkholderia phage Maja TaxID=2767571 RepID=A0A7S6TXE3_9CAUD|nr:putative membrane protein [Burkholderia phage Maja]
MKQFLWLWVKFTFTIPFGPFLPDNWKAWGKFFREIFIYIILFIVWILLTITLPFSAPLLALVQCMIDRAAKKERARRMEEHE